MSRPSMSEDIRIQLDSADPGTSVTESELARSRARSLAFLSPDTQTAPLALHDGGRGNDHHHAPVDGDPKVIPLPSRPRRFVRRTLLLSAAAAVLAGALVASDALNLGRGQAPAIAQAAEVLNRAADSAIRTADPVVRPGQYLKLDITESIIMAPESAGPDFRWNEREANQLYVPYDRSGEWVLNLGPYEPVEYFGAATKEKVRDYYATQPLQGPEPGRQIRGLAGKFLSGQTTSFGNLTPEEEATIPQDPAALLAWIKAETKGTDDGTWGFIADQLKSGVVPAKWRAALYRAAALVPGATISEQQATLDGRAGTAVGRTDQDGIRTDLIFDPESGLFIGQRVINEKGFGPIPAGTKTGWTSVKTSVASSVP
jgi:hypothetical protein